MFIIYVYIQTFFKKSCKKCKSFGKTCKTQTQSRLQRKSFGKKTGILHLFQENNGADYAIFFYKKYNL